MDGLLLVGLCQLGFGFILVYSADGCSDYWDIGAWAGQGNCVSRLKCGEGSVLAEEDRTLF